MDGAGLVTAVGIGSATITATALGGATASVSVTVDVVANTVRVTPAGIALSGVGSTQTLTVEVRDVQGIVVTNPSVTWASLNPAVATVSGAGVVTAVGAGQATVVATSGVQSATALVTVSVSGTAPVNVWAPMTSGTTQLLNGVWQAGRS